MSEFLRATAKVASSFAIRGVRVRPGEEFRVDSERAGDLLVKLGLAERVEGLRETPPVLLAPPPETAPTESASPPEPPKRKRGRPRKGEYLRRDMRAEE